MTGTPDEAEGLAPEVAAHLLEAADADELRRLADRIESLAKAYRMHLDGDCAVSVVTGPRVVAERIAQAQAKVRTELRALVGPGAWRPGAEVAHRIVAVEPDPADPGCRSLPTVPVTAYLADHRFAVIVTNPETVIVSYSGALLDATGALFEALWSKANPDRVLSAVDAEVAELLLAGATDAAIARHLGVGPRTVQRRIAEFHRQLGATTRFQAGVQAAMRAGAAAAQGRPG
ncbi:helix-turn-helix domain-containing protein [Hamadaea sp. NPDC051192]|uniref:helix-turn-helix domain-containing protein n=1 Tax=Hamadaea sp. NPDC051192 TaxID=3154940 RepID=UPI00343F1A6B